MIFKNTFFDTFSNRYLKHIPKAICFLYSRSLSPKTGLLLFSFFLFGFFISFTQYNIPKEGNVTSSQDQFYRNRFYLFPRCICIGVGAWGTFLSERNSTKMWNNPISQNKTYTFLNSQRVNQRFFTRPSDFLSHKTFIHSKSVRIYLCAR